jgi:nucleotide-binding universal stress UspA family protein
MKQLKKILFPTDYSLMAKGAFVYALKLAKQFGAKIKVVHVYRADFGVPVPETVAYQMLEARKEEAEKNMSFFVNLGPESEYRDVVIETSVEIGFSSDLIVDYSKNASEEIDLIIMGTKGEHNLAEQAFGSVTSNVIRDAKCPVLAVPENVRYEAVNSVVYATDLKSDNVDSVREAAEISTLLNATLHCVCVDTKAQDLSAALQQFSALVNQMNIDAKIVEISSDTIAHGLDQYVHENGIDMLLMLRPQRSLLERIFHSSVTKQVSMQSSVPLLVFKK